MDPPSLFQRPPALPVIRRLTLYDELIFDLWNHFGRDRDRVECFLEDVWDLQGISGFAYLMGSSREDPWIYNREDSRNWCLGDLRNWVLSRIRKFEQAAAGSPRGGERARARAYAPPPVGFGARAPP